MALISPVVEIPFERDSQRIHARRKSLDGKRRKEKVLDSYVRNVLRLLQPPRINGLINLELCLSNLRAVSQRRLSRQFQVLLLGKRLGHAAQLKLRPDIPSY